jgi:two-component system, cell cycle sensor histidine kinase and response regulator CckA
MKDEKKTKKQLISELELLRQSIKQNESPGESNRQAFYRLATEHSNEAVIIINKDKRLFYNQRYLELAGCKTPEELEQKPFLYGIHPDDQELIREMIRQRQEGKPTPSRYECRLLKPDGSFMYVEISSSVITYMGQPASLGYVRDISDRKEAENRINKAQREWENIFEAIGQPTAIINPQYIILAANKALIDAARMPLKDILGKKCHEIFHGQNSKNHPDGCPLAKLLLTGKMETAEMEVDAFGGSYLITCIPVFNNEDRMEQIIHIATDMTEKKQMEESRSKLETQLFQAQKMEAVGTLAGGIAHDFNNILMGIQGYVSLTKLDLKPDHPHYERLQKIEEQIMNGANLTRQLLGFARGGKYQVKPTNLNKLLKESAAIFSRTKKEISISNKLQKDLWMVDTDQGQIDQVLLNIYINAWQAMPQGGDIYLESQNVTLSDTNVQPYDVHPGRYVKISVTDTGIGMDEQIQKRIFEPFFTTKRPDKGTGLGLASVYGIIKNHAGFITVSSELGKGSTFNIFLPASDQNKMIEEKSPEHEMLLTGKETILLVDDELSNVAPTKELLENIGYRVTIVGSGQEAITIYMEKWKEIDLVILDMIMPGISGGNTFDALQKINPAVKVILSSGYSVDGDAQQIMNRGCKGFIQKPFRIITLSKKIREILII